MTTQPVARTIQSLSQFVAYVKDNCSRGNVLFRGQCVDEPLLPKIARLRPRRNITVAEREMLDDWKRQAPGYVDLTPKNDWEWLALAQHFGMATRLLDWTLNPFAALWFAVQRPAKPGDRGVVWFFEAADADYWDPEQSVGPLEIRRTWVFRPRLLTRRIIAQSGWFTAHKFTESRQQNYVPLERNVRFKHRLTKLSVPKIAFSDLRRDLDRFGVNAASLYGDPDGLCRHLEWLHSYAEDEPEEEAADIGV